MQHRYANIELICNNAERKVAVANIIFEVFFFHDAGSKRTRDRQAFAGTQTDCLGEQYEGAGPTHGCGLFPQLSS